MTVIESLMLLEREEEYLKGQEGRQDIGNGSYMRDFRSLSINSLQISILRSWNGKSKPMLLELINTQEDQLNQLCVLLYQRGLSTRDVAGIMEAFFGESISKDTISNLASSFHDIRKK
ncbi:MAG: transposase [Bacteroidota bacterium]